MKITVALSAVALVGACLPQVARAAIFNDLTLAVNYPGGGSISSTTESEEDYFYSTGSFIVGEYDVAGVTSLSPPTPTAFTDSTGNFDAVWGVWNNNGTPVFAYMSDFDESAQSSAWLAAAESIFGNSSTWNSTLQTLAPQNITPYLDSADGYSGTLTASFVSVPEPATYGAIAGAGLLALSLCSQLRRKQSSLSHRL